MRPARLTMRRAGLGSTSVDVYADRSVGKGSFPGSWVGDNGLLAADRSSPVLTAVLSTGTLSGRAAITTFTRSLDRAILFVFLCSLLGFLPFAHLAEGDVVVDISH